MGQRTINIDLQTYRTPHAKVFAGRPRGLYVRNASDIDKLVQKYDKISITIPDDISSINPSFLEEFLENVVSELGEAAFFEKFTFINNGRYKIEDDLKEAIDRILRNINAIA
jgi:hypothetical protein